MGTYYTILEELRIRTRSGILLRSYSYTKRCKSTIHGKQCRANCKAISIAGYNAGSKFSVSFSKNCTHVATLQDWALICQLSHWHSSEEQKPRQGVTLMLSVQVLPLQSSLEFIPLAQSSAFRFYIISLSPTGEEWSQGGRCCSPTQVHSLLIRQLHTESLTAGAAGKKKFSNNIWCHFSHYFFSLP